MAKKIVYTGKGEVEYMYDGVIHKFKSNKPVAVDDTSAVGLVGIRKDIEFYVKPVKTETKGTPVKKTVGKKK